MLVKVSNTWVDPTEVIRVAPLRNDDRPYLRARVWLRNDPDGFKVKWSPDRVAEAINAALNPRCRGPYRDPAHLPESTGE